MVCAASFCCTSFARDSPQHTGATDPGLLNTGGESCAGISGILESLLPNSMPKADGLVQEVPAHKYSGCSRLWEIHPGTYVDEDCGSE